MNQLNGERGRPARSFRRLAENLLRVRTAASGETRGAKSVGETPTGATGTVAIPSISERRTVRPQCECRSCYPRWPEWP